MSTTGRLTVEEARALEHFDVLAATQALNLTNNLPDALPHQTVVDLHQSRPVLRIGAVLLDLSDIEQQMDSGAEPHNTSVVNHDDDPPTPA